MPRIRRFRAALTIAALAIATVTAIPVQAAAPPPAAVPVAPATASCQFVLGFASLQAQLGQKVGSCLDNQQFAPNGDAQQPTSTGLLAWVKADNLAKFTNGYQTWIAGPNGLVDRFNDEWFEWEAYPAETDGVPVDEPKMAPPSPSEVDLGPLLHVDQTMDNCGPAAIAEVLRYYGVTKTQQELKTILRAGDPTGMVTGVIAPYAASIGFRALVSQRGTDALLKAMVRNNVPVIVEQPVSAADGMLHYRAIEGYDEGLGQFIAASTLLGPRHAISYAEFDKIWGATHGTFAVIYPPSKQAAVNAAIAQAKWR